MHILKHGTYIALVSFGLVACGGGTSTDTSVLSSGTPIDKTITITNNPHVESLGQESSINLTVNVGNTPKSLYLLLSNSATASTSTSITHDAKILKIPELKKESTSASVNNLYISETTKKLEDFKANVHLLFSHLPQAQKKVLAVPDKLEDVTGQSQVFKLDSNGFDTTNATARKVVSNVSTSLGTKTLNIWVSDDSFDSGRGCIKKRCVTQTMVDALADTFLKVGNDNDLYDWVTNVYGEEWESDTNGVTNVISANNEISILLVDIDADNRTDGGALGFFHPKDNFTLSSVSGSNERIMFYVDAVLFANGEGSWNINDFWPKEMISTLAHEFQHMIHFYQKAILLTNDETDTWINEMLSETTEDLIATKINHTGSRGVDPTDGSAGSAGNTLGRYPLFNQYNKLSLTSWDGQLEDYSKVNAFGAYLIRNYGGAKVLHDIMHNNYLNQQAVVAAVNLAPNGEGKTFDDLLKEWGTAVLLSDNDNLGGTLPEYNTGDFISNSYNNSIYQIGSVNFFNYSPLPTIFTTVSRLNAQSNYYYKVGDNLTGTVNIALILNGQTEVTVIAK